MEQLANTKALALITSTTATRINAYFFIRLFIFIFKIGVNILPLWRERPVTIVHLTNRHQQERLAAGLPAGIVPVAIYSEQYLRCRQTGTNYTLVYYRIAAACSCLLQRIKI